MDARTIAIILAVAAAVIGMILWGGKYDRRGLVLLVAGLCVLIGMFLVGRL